MILDFTLGKYNEIISALKENGSTFYTVRDWIENDLKSGVVLRHDVDRRAWNSLKTAKFEMEYGIRATYYFRIVNCSFKEEVISSIAEMGHEIGYHYEELTTYNGDYETAIRNFRINLDKVRKFYDVRTIAMHGKPTSKIDNRDLWKKFDYKDFGITGDAYLSIDYKDIYYFSDTGRNWKSKTAKNYKDYTNGIRTEGVETSDELINFIKDKKPEKLFIMTHPERWNDNAFGYSLYYLRDVFIGNVKRIYYFFR